MAGKQQFFLCFFLCVFLVDEMAASPYRIKKSADSTIATCEKVTPCGWAIYSKEPGQRDIKFFMKNKCTCEEGKQCVKAEEDISQYAYVYRCQIYNPPQS